MNDHLVRPSGTLTLAGVDYKLDGSFETLAAVEEAAQLDILQLSGSMMDLRIGQLARVIASALTASGTRMTPAEAGNLLIDEVDITSIDYQRVKAQLMAWLFVALAPKKDREEREAKMGEWMASLGETARLASRGENTRKSA